MSLCANVVWANVTMGKYHQGKRLWAKASGQKLLGKYRYWAK
jgi:hypothetical protein